MRTFRSPVVVRDRVVRRGRQLQVRRGVVHHHRRDDRDRSRVYRTSEYGRLRRLAVQPVRRSGRQTGGRGQRGP